jgi:hypothetical protein
MLSNDPIVVTTLSNTVNGSDGVLSFQEAITQANDTSGADTIEFDPTLFSTGPGTMAGGYSLQTDITINGPGAKLLTIDANGGAGLIIGSGVVATIRGITITDVGGYYEGINSAAASLTVLESHITGSTGEDVVAIYQSAGGSSTLTVKDTTISNNSTSHPDSTGGILVGSYTDFYLINSTISGNTGDRVGAIDFKPYSTGTILNSTITDNSGYASGGIYIGDYASVTIKNSIISGNTGGEVGQSYYSYGYSSY